jgi:copper chaperone CopZ
MNIKSILALSISLMLSLTIYSQEEYSTLVQGVCGMCEDRIEKAALSLDFVKQAKWEVDKQLLTVEVTSNFNEKKLHNAITAAGHDTELKEADTEIYDQIHECCKYRDPWIIENHHITPYNMRIPVSGVCEMCKERIEKAANALSVVDTASYIVGDQTLYILTPSDIDLSESKAKDRVAQHIAEIGHDAGQYTAQDEAYEQLPDCCKYRDPEVRKDHGFDIGPQETVVSGYVYEQTDKGKQVLVYADVYSPDKQHFTTSDEEGYFEMKIPRSPAKVVVNYTGYEADTMVVRGITEVEVILSNIKDLQEVVVSYRRKTSGVSELATAKTINVDEGEFLKAACCNLAESFETLPAVDVAITDAVTGTRQIKMLGLSGPNILYSREQIPILTGITSTQGISLIPGTWLAGMNLNQGIGSVAEGYQSVSGQINVELQKPESMDPLFLNVYGNEGGRLEANAHLAHRFSEKLSTGLLIHSHTRNRELDRNDDGFLDAPTGRGISFLNRWKYNSGKNIMGQAGIKYTSTDKESGQLSKIESPQLWRSSLEIRELQSWAKVGYILPNSSNSSIALRLGANSFRQKSIYGDRQYEGEQDNVHAKFLFQGNLGSPDHKLRSGIGINIENSDEQLGSMTFIKEEIVPNVFGEYTLHIGESFSAIAGLRYDIHNIYGDFLTPRLHLRYKFDFGLDLRMAAGQARRMASVISENLSFLASSRNLNLMSEELDYQPYGLPMIKSNNFSASADYSWVMFNNEASLSLDYFYTLFDENIIADMDHNINQLQLYAQETKSISHNMQVQMDMRPVEGMDIRLAYKWQNYQLGYNEGLRLAPFTPIHRGFLNVAYATDNNWTFDMTFNLTGPQRIPDTDVLPKELEMPSESPAFLRINAQINKEIFPGFIAYLGVENLTNYQQEYAIINADEPFSDSFDASLIWGPTMGRNVYLGVRYTIVPFDENKFVE